MELADVEVPAGEGITTIARAARIVRWMASCDPPPPRVVVCRLASRASASQLGRWLPNSGPGTAGATHRYRSGGVNGVSAIPLGVRYPRSHPPPRATRSRRWSPRRGW